MATKEDTGTEKDLAYYLQHPEEADPTNTALMQQLLAASSETEGGAKKAEEAPKEEKTEAPEKQEAKPAGEAAKPDAPAKPAGDGGEAQPPKEGDVLAADGKSLIPFSVLRQAREAAGTAEAALREATESNLALTERIKALEAGKAAPAGGEGAKTIEELETSLEAIRTEAPWLAPTLEKLIANQRALEERLEQANEKVQQGAAEREESVKAEAERLQQQANTALEGNATLLLWKAERPDLFKEAVQQDVLLRRDPELAKQFVNEQGQVDFARRFERCVRIVKAAHEGEDIPLPKAVVKTDPAPDPKKEPALDPEKTKQIAKEKVAKAAAPEVVTLTDVPGGTPAAQSEQEAIENESVSSLGSRLMNLAAQGPDKLNAWLARNG